MDIFYIIISYNDIFYIIITYKNIFYILYRYILYRFFAPSTEKDFIQYRRLSVGVSIFIQNIA